MFCLFPFLRNFILSPWCQEDFPFPLLLDNKGTCRQPMFPGSLMCCLVCRYRFSFYFTFFLSLCLNISPSSFTGFCTPGIPITSFLSVIFLAAILVSGGPLCFHHACCQCFPHAGNTIHSPSFDSNYLLGS